MACNWSYDNPPSNKKVWWVVLTITITGIILIITGVIGGYADQDCFRKYNQCRKTYSTETCADKYNDICNLRTWAGLIVAGAIVWVCGAAFTSYFCCCSRPLDRDPYTIALQPMPYPQGHPAAYPPQAVVGVPLAAGAAGYPPQPYPQAYPYPYPTQGPYAAPPGTWPQAPPQYTQPPQQQPPPPQQPTFQAPEMTTATVLTQGHVSSTAPQPPPTGASSWKGSS